MSSSASVVKRGLVGARASGLKSVSGPSMASFRPSLIPWVGPGTVHWVSGSPPLALPLESIVLVWLDGPWGPAWTSSWQEGAMHLVLSEGP